MIIALYIILGVYVALIGSFIVGFNRLKEFEPKQEVNNVNFSIIIPFRNEEVYLPHLLESIRKLHYPTNQFECLFVDDDSDDDSMEIIEKGLMNSGINFRMLKNQRKSKSPKKDAISTAIVQSQFGWIITTDADCVLPEGWLKTMASYIQEKSPEMVVGPVTYKAVNFSFLEHFQILDLLSLQGSTVGGFGIGKPFLCNGANLAYKKETFLALNGFDGNDTIASGDDIFLFEKFIKADSKKVQFLKSTSAIVSTFPLKSWKEVIEQRTRWAAKSSSYHLIFTKLVGLIVLLMNGAFIASFFLLFKEGYFSLFLTLVLTKLIFDLTLIESTSNYYKSQRRYVFWFLEASLLYPMFSIFIAIRSTIVKYTWKGRKFKK